MTLDKKYLTRQLAAVLVVTALGVLATTTAASAHVEVTASPAITGTAGSTLSFNAEAE